MSCNFSLESWIARSHLLSLNIEYTNVMNIGDAVYTEEDSRVLQIDIDLLVRW